MVTGRVEQGKIETGDEIEIVGIKDTVKTTCTGVEMFKKTLDRGEAGDNVVAARRQARGRVAGAGAGAAGHACDVEQVRGPGVRADQGGGRPPHALLFQLPPAVLHAHRRHHGRCAAPEGTEMVMPGDNATVTIELIQPVALEEGLKFAMREGGPHRGRWRRIQAALKRCHYKSVVLQYAPCTESLTPLRLAQDARRRDPLYSSMLKCIL